MRKITFVRHGESTANRGVYFADASQVGITDLGREAAKSFAAEVMSGDGDRIAIYASTFIRTQETAQPLADRFKTRVNIKKGIQEFTYLDPSRFWEGMTTKEREAPLRDYWERLDPIFVDSQKCESFLRFTERLNGAARWCKRLQQSSNENYIFCHGNFMRGLVLALREFGGGVDINSRTDPTFFMSRFRETLFSREIDFKNLQTADILGLL